jgi:hypothetical protein
MIFLVYFGGEVRTDKLLHIFCNIFTERLYHCILTEAIRYLYYYHYATRADVFLSLPFSAYVFEAHLL